MAHAHRIRRVLTAALVGVTLVAAGAGRVDAQGKYPSRPIELVVPNAPGGGTDNLARMIVAIIEENKLSPVSINVVNKPGGSSAIGYGYLIGKKGNPYVVAGANPVMISGKIEGRLTGDHRDGMTMLMVMAVDELMLSVKADSKYQTVEEFVKAARERPGQLTMGGTGTNTEDHIFTVLLERAAGIKLKYVPFNSGGEVTAALMGGHVDGAVENPNEIQAQIDAKKAKNLAVAAKKRLKDAADIPTFAERGFEFYWDQMRGMVGPADMGAEALQWWQDVLRKVTETRRWQEEYIKRNLLTPTTMIGEAANQYLDGLRDKYGKALADLKK